jgi:hypothetical protein
MNIAGRLMADARIIPVRTPNKAKTFTRNSDGSATVVTGAGESFALPADAETLQAFVVWTMLNSELTERTP